MLHRLNPPLLQLKCWLLPGEEAQKKKEMAALAAPPPSKVNSLASLGGSSASLAGQAGGDGAAGPLNFAGRLGNRSGISSRYASATNLKVAAAEGDAAGAGSLLAGVSYPVPRIAGCRHVVQGHRYSSLCMQLVYTRGWA